MPSYRNIIKTASGAAFRSFLAAIGPLKRMSVILMYHRVLKDSSGAICDPAMFVTAQTFESHIQELSRFFEFVPIESIIENKANKRRCAVTFDDGWKDNYDFAFPVIKKYGITATVFMPVRMIGQDKRFWFQSLWELYREAEQHNGGAEFINHFIGIVPSWRPKGLKAEDADALISGLKHLPADELDGIIEDARARLSLSPLQARDTLNWDEAREMGLHGIAFGSHGLDHRILTRTDSETKKAEVFDSLRILKHSGVRVSDFFSYPNGEYDEESASLVKEAGYIGAVTTALGCNLPGENPFTLKRIGMHEHISGSPNLMWFRLMQAAGEFKRAIK